MKRLFHNSILRWVMAISGLVLTIHYGLENIPSYPYGDGTEYVMITESLYNHGSLDLQESDVTNYIEILEERNGGLQKKDVYESLAGLAALKEREVLSGWYGFFTAKNGELYCFHFWFYSALNVPARAVIEMFEGDITQTYLVTNIILMFLALIVIVYNGSLNNLEKLITSILFIFSPTFWYLAWPHPEVLTSVLVFSSLLLFYDKKYLWSLLLMSISAMHFPPLFIPSGIILLYVLWLNWKNKKLSIVLFVKLFFCSFWIVIPPLFYLYHFDIPNLIVHQGYIDTDNLNLNRLHSFFFDLNQGMIIGIPFVFIVVLVLVFRMVFKKAWDIYYLLLFSILFMSVFFLQMNNWNHGMAVINRYGVWTSMIFLFIFIVKIRDVKVLWKSIIFGIAIVSQIAVTTSFIDYKDVFWGSAAFHNSLAKWVLNEHPEYYNPDPGIFIGRNSAMSISTTDSVIVYSRPDSKITKMLICKCGGISQLEARGIHPDSVAALGRRLDYYQDWAYVERSELDRVGYVQSLDTFIDYAMGINVPILREEIRQNMLSSPQWMESMAKVAEENNRTLEEVMEDNIEWLLKKDIE